MIAWIVLSPFLGGILVAAAGPRRGALASRLSVLASAGSALAAFACLRRVLAEGAISYPLGGWAPPLGIEWVLDPLSGVLSLLVAVVAAAVLAYAGPSLEAELPERAVPYRACALLLVAGLQGIVVTGDLFNLYVFLEVASLTAYALVAVGERQAPVAAFRYLILGTIGATLYLLGVGHLYAATGSLNMADVASALPAADPGLARLGFVLILAGLSLKMGLFPLHGWMPDAYTHAPSASSALLSGLVSKVMAYALLRVAYWVFGTGLLAAYAPFLAAAGAAAVLAAAALAFAQTDLKRMLAYSSVGHVGAIALGVGLGTRSALVGALLHVLNHAAMKAGLFMCLGAFSREHGVRRVEELGSLRGRMPWTSAAFAALALSMVGVPPFGGFFSKWWLLVGALEAGSLPYAAVLVASGLLSAGYFFRALDRLFLSHGEGGRAEAPVLMRLPVVGAALAVLALGLGSGWLRTTVIEPALPAELLR